MCFMYKRHIKRNKNFITFITKNIIISINPSMITKNLKTANSGILTQFNNIYPKNYSLIDQKSHDGEDVGKKGVIPKFYRNLKLIMNHIKNKDKLYSFNETNIL